MENNFIQFDYRVLLNGKWVRFDNFGKALMFAENHRAGLVKIFDTENDVVIDSIKTKYWNMNDVEVIYNG